MTSKLQSYMGFASKAGKLVSGTNTCMYTMDKGKAKLLIVAEDVSDNTKDKVISKAKYLNVEYRVFGKADDLAHYTGKYGAGVFVITDDNFKEVITRAIDDTNN